MLRILLGLALAVLVVPTVVYAQQPDTLQDEQLTPPQLIEINAPELTTDESMLDVVIEVSATGDARLVSCPYRGSVCQEVHRVLQSARIEPARSGGTHAVDARVSLRLLVATPPGASRLSAPKVNAPALREEPAVAEFGARARVEKQQGERAFQSREIRDIPGAFGDPFRAITALPSVVTVLSGVPYVYVRGAPPAGNAYYYDDIPVPALFHLALGPAVVHPRMVGDVKMFPAAAPARYGRLTGAVIRGLGPEKPSDETIGELELRLIDVNGFAASRVGDGIVQVAGRYGYPGLLLSIFSPEATLAYWDYQARFWYPLDEDNELSFVWFGSYDSVGEINDGEETDIAVMEFHRGELRHAYNDGDFRLLTALMIGYERSSIDDNEVAVDAFRLKPRVVATNRLSKQISFEAGFDYEITVGEITTKGGPGDDIAGGDELGLGGSFLAAADWRMASGIYGMLQFDLSPLKIDVGVRGDLWATNLHTDLAPALRGRASYRLSSVLELRAGAGLNYQPATFIIPLPGFSDVALDQGLQRSVQTEIGAAITLPEAFELELTGFLNHYNNMIFPELFIEKSLACEDEDGDGCADFSGNIPRADGVAYGLEVFLRRSIDERVSGWIAYTLGAATAKSDAGIAFPTEADIRHNLNLVSQIDLGSGFKTGLRLFARSGKPETRLLGPLQRTRRLPSFFRIDAHVAYAWKTHWGRFRLALEWFNVAMTKEPLRYDCTPASFLLGTDGFGERCGSDQVEYAPAIFFPSLSLRATF